MVVGVHSSKFSNEKETDNIRSAVLRYDVKHPVINDRDFTIWKQYGVRAWPTLMFIHPDGRVIGKHEGEFDPEKFDELIADMGREFRSSGYLNNKPLEYQLESTHSEHSQLMFPAKLAVDPTTGRLAISDSGHHRILITSFCGVIEETIGSGCPGAEDGPSSSARFNRPQGIVFDKESLYVADSENHTIRVCNLMTKTVTTIAGTGYQSLFRHEGGNAKKYPLNSPYDVEIKDGRLYVAMAGSHQLWVLDIKTMDIAPFAGDGIENIQDGPLRDARLAQPYGIVAGPEALFFADSETSSIRSAGYSSDGAVRTLVGIGLFDFGDRDGPFRDALLQHTQAVAIDGNFIYIADTYNNKVKVLDMNSEIVSTVAGTGKRGKNDGPAHEATFNEPGGIAVIEDSLYIADTNNHAIRVVSLRNRTVSTLCVETT